MNPAGPLPREQQLLAIDIEATDDETLTHMVRNSCDHGIELPEERKSAGKPGPGTITLAALHQRGSVVIEVRDDGRGLSRPHLLKKARERGIDAPDGMADADVWALIFTPGFSTVGVATDVSGCGVGTDVVKKTSRRRAGRWRSTPARGLACGCGYTCLCWQGRKPEGYSCC